LQLLKVDRRNKVLPKRDGEQPKFKKKETSDCIKTHLQALKTRRKERTAEN